MTLRLAYPVKVKAVTIDHASKHLFDSEEQRTSAPKKVRVIGYPPCLSKKVHSNIGGVKKSDYLDDYGDDGDEYVQGVCDDGLDFDVESPIVLHDFEFDLDGPSIQTFHIPSDSTDGSCSEDTGTCGGSLDGPNGGVLNSSPDRSDSIDEGVSAIQLQITDNWGNKDYTCVYRFRVHGDTIDPNE